MFKKKIEPLINDKDTQVLFDAMKKIAEGDISFVDVSVFDNINVGKAINDMILGFKKNVNSSTLMLNNSMEIIGNSECIKEMIDQVQSQTSSISEMSKASQSLGDSIGNISAAVENIIANTSEASETVRKSCENMEQSIKVVNEATAAMEDINGKMISFKQKTEQINEIITIVKSIAKQSNLLALNASIEAARAGEAGKGFAVVANEVKELSNNTASSVEDVVKYITELQSGIDGLVDIIDEATKRINEGNIMVENSINEVTQINSEIKTIDDEINSIYSVIEVQSVATNSFSEAITNFSNAYEELLQDCMNTGEHMYKISRSVDKVRTKMVKSMSSLSRAELLRIFEIDHIIYVWRQYNAIQGYEVLTRVQGSKSCKLGKWMEEQKDPRIVQNDIYKKMFEIHNNMHAKAADCWNANNEERKEDAMRIFEDLYSCLQEFITYINKLKDVVTKIDEEDARKSKIN